MISRTNTLALLVLLAAGVQAAPHTAHMAQQTGAAEGWLAWTVPVSIECGALAAGALASARHQVGLPWRFEGTIVTCLLALAMAVNASAVSGAWPGEGVVLAGVAPAILAALAHGLIRSREVQRVLADRAEREQAERERADAERRARAQRQAERSAQRKRHTPVRVRKPSAPPSSTAAPPMNLVRTPAPRGDVDAWLRADPYITGAIVAERLGVSAATGRRRLAEARTRRDGDTARMDDEEPAA